MMLHDSLMSNLSAPTAWMSAANASLAQHAGQGEKRQPLT